MRRALVSVLACTAVFAAGATLARCPSGRTLVQEMVQTPGFPEPHTPGSGASDEFAVSATLAAIQGPTPDLNQVTTLRSRIAKPSGAPPRVVVILVPGFLSGASVFQPLARDLVEDMNGQLEVWVVERRPNLLEDRRGAEHSLAAARAAGADGAAIQDAIDQGMRFYFDPIDLDGDAVAEPPFPLPDAAGGSSGFRLVEQDDMRFAAWWGIDTYLRDWKLLVAEARGRVGDDGLVLFGGHSMGTSWAAAFAAYDFDPGPGVLAGHSLIDGLLLLEGGGLGPGASVKPSLAEYQQTVAELASSGGPPVYLPDVNGLFPTSDLGKAAEIGGIAAHFLPAEPAVLKSTSLFGGFPVSLLLGAPMTNRALLGFFIDDDFTTNRAFSASMGFSDDGNNPSNLFAPLLEGDFYSPDFFDQSTLRTWKGHDDPSLPACPPEEPVVIQGSGLAGCAILDNGSKPGAGEASRPWGTEREVTDVDEFMTLQFTNGNFVEWYFVSGRVFLDFSFGNDSSSLGDESLLAITRNSSVDVPVLCIGGSNGLAETEADFAPYLGSIATPPADQEILIIEGYAHIDLLTAVDNETVPPLVDWINRLLQRRLLASF